MDSEGLLNASADSESACTCYNTQPITWGLEIVSFLSWEIPACYGIQFLGFYQLIQWLTRYSELIIWRSNTLFMCPCSANESQDGRALPWGPWQPVLACYFKKCLPNNQYVPNRHCRIKIKAGSWGKFPGCSRVLSIWNSESSETTQSVAKRRESLTALWHQFYGRQQDKGIPPHRWVITSGESDLKEEGRNQGCWENMKTRPIVRHIT